MGNQFSPVRVNETGIDMGNVYYKNEAVQRRRFIMPTGIQAGRKKNSSLSRLAFYFYPVPVSSCHIADDIQSEAIAKYIRI